MFKAEDLKKVNEELNKIDVKGKRYAMVTERIKGFRSICPCGSISTEIISLENGVVTMMATISDENGNVLGTGLAQEKESNGYINKTSFIENCETSAVGRALGFVGIGIDDSMASAEEVANAIKNQGKEQKSAPHRKDTPEEAQKNEEMRSSVDPVFLPTRDKKITKEQWEYYDSELKRTGIDEKVILSTYSVNSKEELTQAQLISAFNKFKVTPSKK